MPTETSEPTWKSVSALAGRLIFAAVFAMALAFKFAGMGATAGYIAAAGFPVAALLAWLAAIFEGGLVPGLPHRRVLLARRLCSRRPT